MLAFENPLFFCLHRNYQALGLKSEPKLLKWNDIIVHIDRAER